MAHDPENWGKYVIQEYSTRKLAFADEPKCIAGHLDNGLCINRCAGAGRWREMSKEARSRMSQHTKKLNAARWAKASNRRKMSKAMKAAALDPEVKARRSAAQKKMWAEMTPDKRAYRVARVKEGQKSDSFKSKLSAEWEKRRKDKKWLTKCGEKQKQVWAEPALRKKHSLLMKARLKAKREAVNERH